MATKKQTTKKQEQPVLVTLSELTATIAGDLDQDTTKVGKKLRARIRSNFADLAPEWPGLTESKENRDGNRYPPMPSELAEALRAKMTAKIKAES